MRGWRADRPAALLGLGAALFAVCLVVVGALWRNLEPGPSAAGRRLIPRSRPAPRPPRIDDGRAPKFGAARLLGALPSAAASWWESQGPKRVVVDQVCLVPDVPSFLEALAQWDDAHYFPILIDDPAWTIPFLRAFRPARIVRPAAPRSDAPLLSRDREALWSAAVRAVGRSWSSPEAADSERRDGARPPRDLGRTPPGVVLSEPDGPTLAAAAALAAGRFQPLLRFEPWRAAGSALNLDGRRPTGRRPDFATVLPLAEARRFARRLEERVAAAVSTYTQLGDDCDFLTLAGDWPYRYLNDQESGRMYGEAALDDLVGRILEPELADLGKSKVRWAFAGRLLGDPAAGVYRAMCSLFLPPDSALLWNTYGGGEPWKYYGMGGAAEIFARAIPGPLWHRADADADLANWHVLTESRSSRTRLVFLNSSGGPNRFAIHGGTGRPGDVPPGGPAAVVMIHSFSAADPTNPRTIAGRWLALGAFVYYGSMNEPFLNAFRSPSLVADLLAAAVPMAAAVREGPAEAFGQPWRLAFLGDPLYRIDVPSEVDPSGRGGGRERDRLPPRNWKSPGAGAFAPLPAPVAAADPATESAGAALNWCLNAAFHDACGATDGLAGADGDRPLLQNWRGTLAAIPRDRLDLRERPVWDSLVLDAILRPEDGRPSDFWFKRLADVPAAEWSPQVEAFQEYGTIHRLVLAAHRDDFEAAVSVWDQAIRRTWPAGSQFPAHVTERVGAVLGSRDRLQRWRDRLKRARGAVAVEAAARTTLEVVDSELKRVESKLAESR